MPSLDIVALFIAWCVVLGVGLISQRSVPVTYRDEVVTK